MRTGRLAACVLLAALAAAGCRRAPEAPAAPRQALEDFTLSQTLRGVLRWRMRARSAVLHEESNLADLSEPTMDFYEEGRLASRVTALAGQARLDTHDVALSSAVVLEVLQERAVLRTDSLNYSSRENLFTTQADVLIQRPEGRLRGRGLQAKPDLSEIRIFHQKAVVRETEG